MNPNMPPARLMKCLHCGRWEGIPVHPSVSPKRPLFQCLSCRETWEIVFVGSRIPAGTFQFQVIQ